MQPEAEVGFLGLRTRDALILTFVLVCDGGELLRAQQMITLLGALAEADEQPSRLAGMIRDRWGEATLQMTHG